MNMTTVTNIGSASKRMATPHVTKPNRQAITIFFCICPPPVQSEIMVVTIFLAHTLDTSKSDSSMSDINGWHSRHNSPGRAELRRTGRNIGAHFLCSSFCAARLRELSNQVEMVGHQRRAGSGIAADARVVRRARRSTGRIQCGLIQDWVTGRFDEI
jgi:hypothetical protein